MWVSEQCTVLNYVPYALRKCRNVNTLLLRCYTAGINSVSRWSDIQYSSKVSGTLELTSVQIVEMGNEHTAEVTFEVPVLEQDFIRTVIDEELKSINVLINGEQRQSGLSLLNKKPRSLFPV